jgi:cytochrome P450
MRALFNQAFRPSKIAALEPAISDLADRLIGDFVDDGADTGECDWTRQFAIPFPLIVIGLQMGADEDDIWQIKAWTDAWVQRLGMMQTEEEALWSIG